VADSTYNNTGNLFIGCSLIGVTQTPIYSRGVLTFNDCYIKGGVLVTGATIFNNCSFDDEVTDDYPVVFHSNYFFKSITGTVFNKCVIRKTVPKGIFYYGALSLYNTEIYLEYSSDETMESPALGYPDYGKGNNLNVYDRLTGTGQIELGFYSADNGTLILAEDNGHIHAVNFGVGRDWGPNQYTGAGPLATRAIRITSNRQDRLSSDYGATEITVSDGADIQNGTYQDGDIVFKNSTSAGNFIGWTCVTGGVQGSTAVFKQFGSIEA
jgi:hypothetical protein